MGIVERSEELRVLRESFENDRPGAVSVVLIEGAAGTGKTGLLHAFADYAAVSGAAFLGASASRMERTMPLSAVSQLFQEPAMSAAERRRAESLLRDGALAAMAYGADPDLDATVQVPLQVLAGLSETLLAAADRVPLVIGVDDIHHADVPSLKFLLYLARRTRSARVLLVLTECLRAERPHPPLHADLLRLPGIRSLRLKPLSEQGVQELLADRLDPATAQRLAPECHQASGGNPLLVHALVDDRVASATAESDRPVFGSAFRQAVLTCLYQSDTAPLARGVAVLGANASAVLLGRLIQLDVKSTDLLRQVLAATGLLDETGLRHEAVQAAVLGGMGLEERTGLFLRAAELLHGHGAPAAAVADRLIAAGCVRFPWGVPVLRDAAEQAAAEGRLPTAIGYLRLALHDRADDDQRFTLLLRLARVEAGIDPATAARHLPELSRAIRDGRLPAHNTVFLVSLMLWLGRVEDALETLAEVVRENGAACGEPTRRRWLRDVYPRLAAHELFTVAFGAESEDTPLRRLLTAAASPTGTPTQDARDQMLAEAERILQESSPAFNGPTPVTVLATLIYTDELERAEWWCDTFAKSAGQRPVASALVTALRAVVHVRRGELHDAERRAREALNLISLRGWGVAVGLPLATLIYALTAMGEYGKAKKFLDTPVPEAMYDTPLVLPYLQARGRYHLAVGSTQAALTELSACGELMTEWRLDLPSFVPWRSDMAEAYMRLGRRADARRFATDQLVRLSCGGARTRGLTLYALAGASGVEQRGKLLRTAVGLLEEAGDRVELARALASLGETCRATGQPEAATALGRRADLLLGECGADGVRESLQPVPGEPRESGEPDPLTELSEAERRVAEYAANGYTNRQIARALHVTISTVEQHLTRVYRKLNIARRSDLPLKLTLSSQEFPA